MTRIVFVTGRPGIGKTSVLLKAIDSLKRRGYKIGGMISQEVRERGSRVGFEIIDIYTGQRGWLSHVNQSMGPRVGRYRVNRADLDLIGASSILMATEKANIVVIDEIGPMELCSPAFREAVAEALESSKPLLGTIHYKAQDRLIDTIKTREDTEILTVTHENRDNLPNIIIDKIVGYTGFVRQK